MFVCNVVVNYHCYTKLIHFCFFSDYFSTDECQARDIVLCALGRLQSDPDRDVRYFAGRHDSFDINLHDFDTMEGPAEPPYNTSESDPDDRYIETHSAESSDSHNLSGYPAVIDATYLQTVNEKQHKESQQKRIVKELSEPDTAVELNCSSEVVQNCVNGENKNRAPEFREELSEDQRESESIVNHCDINIIIPTAENDPEGRLVESSEPLTDSSDFVVPAYQVGKHCIPDKGSVALQSTSGEKVSFKLPLV